MFTNKFMNFGYVSMVAIVLGLVISASYVNTAQATDHKKIEFKIKGMDCEKCAKTIETVLAHCGGVEGCKVLYKEGKAVVEVETSKSKAEEMALIKEAVEGLGFAVDEMAAEGKW